MKKINIFFYIILLILLVFIFKNIFFLRFLSGGDYTILTKVVLYNFLFSSFYGWNTSLNTGYSVVSFLNHSPFNFFIGILSLIIPYPNLLERIVWWVPFFIISVVSVYKLLSFTLPQNVYSYLSAFLFLFNTYILMILGGGQVEGIGLAYAFFPYILYKFFSIIEKGNSNFKELLLCGLLLSLEIVLDPRITYIMIIALGIYVCLYYVFFKRIKFKNILKVSIYSGLIASLLHAFWIIPSIFIHKNPIAQFGPAYTTINGVKFLSFATIENAIGLLHPNWPENIFGKVNFMRPEFLILPIIIFSIVIFIKITKSENRNNFYICYFLLVSLFGIFLVKGANAPFGNIYLWMFDHIPGFILFRDPTKWFILIIVPYTILLPICIQKIEAIIVEKFCLKGELIARFLLSFFTVGLLVVLILPSFGRLTGIFSQKSFPGEYTSLNTFFYHDSSFSRVLWIPSKQRYASTSNLHPAISAYDFFHVTSISEVLVILQKKDIEKTLSQAGVKYIVIPEDTDGELFIKDRKYDNDLYQKSIVTLNQLDWLKEIASYNKNIVFQTNIHLDHITLKAGNTNTHLSYKQIDPADYIIQLENVTKNDEIFFSESYDSNWILYDGANKIYPGVYKNQYMQFLLSRGGSYRLKLIYIPQQIINIALWISKISFIIVILLYIIASLKSGSLSSKMVQ